jgi:hypothetical protein
MLRLISRASVVVVAVVFGLALPGCGSKITKENADKIKVGMSEKEVTDLLGSPTESEEVELPDLGAMFGGMPGLPAGEAAPVPKMPKKAKKSVWKEGDKTIAVVFLDGKVNNKETTGF